MIWVRNPAPIVLRTELVGQDDDFLQASPLFDTCLAANPGALNAALICASLDIVGHELARLERLRLYATLLGDWQTIIPIPAQPYFLPWSRSHPRRRKRVEVFPALAASLR